MSAPQTQQAVVLTAKDKPLSVQDVAIPQAVPGSAVIKVLATSVPPGARNIFSGGLPFPLAYPFIPGSSAVGRIHALGPDSTSLVEGQLVFVDFLVRSRDDPDASVLLGYIGGFDAGSTKLMEGEWRNGTFAEFAKLPLESVYPLNEELLVKEMGYTFAELTWLGPSFVGAGGPMEIDVHAGDVVIVAPATGYFGGAAVHVALAMGARVIAAARNEKVLAKMEETFNPTGRFKTVKLTGDVPLDSAALKKASGSSKGADAYLDWSPRQAAQTTHIKACIGALRPFGKCALVGGIFGDIEIPYFEIMLRSIRIQGLYMFDRAHALQVIKLVESGLMRLGAREGSGIQVQAGFKLRDIEEAMQVSEGFGWGHQVVLEP